MYVLLQTSKHFLLFSRLSKFLLSRFPKVCNEELGADGRIDGPSDESREEESRSSGTGNKKSIDGTEAPGTNDTDDGDRLPSIDLDIDDVKISTDDIAISSRKEMERIWKEIINKNKVTSSSFFFIQRILLLVLDPKRAF